jgi:hypothetical protein
VDHGTHRPGLSVLDSPVRCGLVAIVMAVNCLSCGKTPAPQPSGRAATAKTQKTDSMTTQLPLCPDGRTLGGLDGQKIRLVGLYRKSLTALKMRGPKKFRGEIHIELRGAAADYDPKAAASLKAIVEIGVRPPEEVERLVDKRVQVDGFLVLDPYEDVRKKKVDYATVIFGPPRLRQVQNVRLQPGTE